MNLLEQIQGMLTSNRVCSCGKKHRLTLKRFELRKPIYKQLAAYGHMGREDLGVSFEKTDMAKELRRICL